MITGKAKAILSGTAVYLLDNLSSYVRMHYKIIVCRYPNKKEWVNMCLVKLPPLVKGDLALE